MNETSIKKLLQDHPGYRITISMNPFVDNDVVFIKVTDPERGLVVSRMFKDLVLNDCTPIGTFSIGYKELFEPFDYVIKEEDTDND